MAEIVEILRVDKNGRVVLPAKARKQAGWGEGEVVAIISKGEIILRRKKRGREAVMAWYEKMLKSRIELPGKIAPLSSKHYGGEYAKRKLGL